MHGFENLLVRPGAIGTPLQGNDCPRVLITGARSSIGHACAEALHSRGAELILCDKDLRGIDRMADALDADGLTCDVASEIDVQKLAVEVIERYSWLDMLINAAGGGYERTLGMYRVSRALLPALRRGSHKYVVNIPPSQDDGDTAVFPYASSGLAFHRLSAALAFEARGTAVAVMIGSLAARGLTQVLPDPNAGSWVEACNILPPSDEDIRTLAWQIASLTVRHASSIRRAS